MNDMKYEHFKAICQDSGLKATSQRFLIYKALADNRNHPTADRLYEMVAPNLPGLSRDTVYRTLNMLASCGLAQKLIMPGGATHFDGDNSAHHHFLCEKCGEIFDMDWGEFDALIWPESALKIGRPDRASVLVAGACRTCVREGRGLAGIL